jgi:hypothetical protein
MRATKYEPRKASFPSYVQPKLNGIRCLWDGETARSREGNEFLPHVQKMLQGSGYAKPPPGWTKDGELWLGLGFGVQDVQSAVTMEQELSKKLLYGVFDAHNGEANGPTFSERFCGIPLSVPTIKVHDETEVDGHYEDFLEQGYEGLIFRTDTPYVFGSGRRDLMKLKPHYDEEYLIVAVWEGTGKNAGTPVFRCLRPEFAELNPRKRVPSSHTFGVVPEGTYDRKRQMWADRDKLIGKKLTVRYWDKYASGVPQFPIGVCVRDYE